MTDRRELLLRAKRTVRAHGRQLVLVKKPVESFEHVWMKAFLWALHLPEHADLAVEVAIGDRFKPDVVALGADGVPVFWGEAGAVAPRKITSLARRFPRTRFVLAKWGTNLDPHVRVAARALRGLRRPATFEMLGFPEDSVDRFVGDRGDLAVDPAAVRRVVVEPEA